MNSNKLCLSDLHLHTNLSFCAPERTTINSFLPYCEQEGIKKIGIANHLYTNMGIEHTLKIKNEIDEVKDSSPVEILLGCEMELFYDEEPMLNAQNARNFDYVMIAPSHIFNQYSHYKNIDLSTAEKIRDVIIDNFMRACKVELGVPTAICHPLYPICAGNQQGILDCMSDKQLRECYTFAADHNKCIEVHACVYRNDVPLDDEGLSPTYIHMLSVAKECGCKFHFGSDAHSTESFLDRHKLLDRAAQRAGICKDDIWNLAKVD